MCKTDNLQSMMTTTKVMSVVQLVFALALIIAGAVAASYNLPKWCNDGSRADYDHCEDQYDDMQGLTRTIALWGTLPGIVPFIFGFIGILAAMKKLKWLIGLLLAFTIVGCILCLIGIFIPFIGASVFTSICENDWDPDNPQNGQIRSTSEGRDFCDRYAGSLWAVVVLNIILAIFQFVFSIILCCICCANETIWAQANEGGAPAGFAMQPMGQQQPMSLGAFAQPVVPQYTPEPPPAYSQPAGAAGQAFIPEARAVK